MDGDRITYCPFCQGGDHISKSRQRLVDIFSFIENSSLGTSFADLPEDRNSSEARTTESRKCKLVTGQQADPPGKNHSDPAVPGA